MLPAIKDKDENTNQTQPVDLVHYLLCIGRFFGHKITPAALKQGLPIENGILTPAYIHEAAHRMDIACEDLLGHPLKLNRTQFPILIITEDENPILLLRKEKEGFIASTDGKKNGWLSNHAVSNFGKVKLWMFRPQFHFDHRSQLYNIPQTRYWFMGVIRRNWRIYFLAGFVGLFINLVTVAVSLYSMTVYDRVIPSNAAASLSALTIGVSIMIFFDLIFKSIRGYLIDVAGRRFDVTIGSKLFAQILDITPKNRPQSAGALTSIIRDFETMREFFTSASLIIISDVPFVSIYIFVIWWIAGPLVYILLAIIVAIIIIQMLIQYPLSKAVAEGMREGAQKIAFITEIAFGIDRIKALNAQGWARRQWEVFLSSNAETSLKSRQWSMLGVNLTGMSASITTIAVVGIGALLIIERELTSGALIAATILSGRTIAPFTQIANLLARWNQTKVAIASLDKIMKSQKEVPEKNNHLLRPTGFEGKIEFKNISFSYPSNDPTTLPVPVFEDFSVAFQPNKMTAILGRIGTGKSTLLKLILNLYQADKGFLLIDDLDVRQIHPTDLRAHIGFVDQETVLFQGTIMDNIRLGGEDLSDDQVLEAAKMSGLEGFLKSNPNGLSTPVGEQGKNLSGGQRQTIGVARAIVSRPSILLMDEPTSMMDHNAERQVIQSLRNISKNRTTIIVTHKVPIMQACDNAIVIEEGRVILNGTSEKVFAHLSGAA